MQGLLLDGVTSIGFAKCSTLISSLRLTFTAAVASRIPRLGLGGTFANVPPRQYRAGPQQFGGKTGGNCGRQRVIFTVGQWTARKREVRGSLSLQGRRWRAPIE